MKSKQNLKPAHLLLAFLAASTFACNSPKVIGVQGDYAFVHADVLTMQDNAVLTDHTVVVGRDGKIKTVTPSKDITINSEVMTIDASEKFLMPGISEMHAHIPVAQNGNDSLVRETLFLYLSNGITVIRGMLGNPYHLELKKQVADGEMLSPRIYTSSPSLNGNSVQTPEEARRKVTQYQKDGYDFLKIHPGIKLNVFEELVRTALDVGITFSGHVPVDVGVRRAIDFGYASIDHLDGYVIGLVPEELNVDPDSAGTFGMNFTNMVDPGLIPELVTQTKEKGIWVVPTQSLLVRWTSPRTGGEMLQDPGMKYMRGSELFRWRGFKERIHNDPHYNPDTMARYINIRNQILKAMNEQGVDLLLGSDAPQIFNVPGFSIHHEMKAMKDAGISNYDILKSGTANPARFFGEAGHFGTIIEGAAADLILLNANPLEDIEHMRGIQGVMVRGHWLPRELIDEKLLEIEGRYAQ